MQILPKFSKIQVLKAFCDLAVFPSFSFQDRDAAGATALHLAARFGFVDVIRWLLSVGGAAGVKTNCGAVPAHYAAANGDLACLKLLIQQAPG